MAANSPVFPGSVQQALLNGDLIRVPFRSIQVATLQVGGSCNLQGGGIKDNPDGSCLGLYMAVTKMASATDFKYAHATFPIHGRWFGLRYLGPKTFPFDVILDGDAHEVTPLSPGNMQSTGVWTGSQNEECIAIIDTDLEDTRHVVEVVLTPDQPGGADRSLTLLGWVGERRLGLGSQIPDVGDLVAGTVPGTQTAVFGSQLPRRVHRIVYTNNHSAAVTVTVKYGANKLKTMVLSAVDTAGSSDVCDLGAAGGSNASQITQAASVAGVVDFAASVTW